MASSPENSPSGKADSTNSSPPASNSTKSGSPPSPPQSPPPSNAPSPSAQKSPPPSPPPGSPPPKSSPPPSSPPPSSPPPSSPSPSSPPPSSPSQSSPPPPTPSGSKTSPSPPPSSGAASPPPSTPNATPTPPSTSNGTPTPPSTSNGTPTPPSTSKGTPTTPDIFSPPPALNAPSTPGGPNQGAHLQSSSGGSSDNTEIIAGAATGGALVLAVVVVALLCILRKRKKTFYIDPATRGGGSEGVGEHVVKLPPPSGVRVSPHSGWGPLQSSPPHSSGNSPGFSDPHQMPISPLNLGKSQFTYDELATATGGFSQAYILGQGGFGMVYKGVLPYGQQVAVKTLKSGSGQGEREFQAEVEIISRVHHRHLVSLVGYCMFKEQRMLVYEFVPNSTLEFHLHGKGQPVMDWKTRFRIAIGSAKGLAYLHEDCHPKIIHRDIKSANILLDNNFEAMVADFGLAKFTSDNISHVSTRVMGTFGYMAPEYASTGKLTDKSDVFSFGVMLLELITGKRPIDPTNNLIEDSLVDWARPLMSKALESGYYAELVDPRLEGYYDPQEMARMVSVASSSIRHSARLRLKMSQIVRTLEGDLDEERLKPGQSIGETEIYDTIAYNADMLKFKNMVMNNSQEYPSSEFRDATSEYDRLTTNSDRDYHSGNLHRV